MRGFAFRSLDDLLDQVIAYKSALYPKWVHCDWFWENDVEGISSLAIIEVSCMVGTERWYWSKHVGRLSVCQPDEEPRLKAILGNHMIAVERKLKAEDIPTVRGRMGGTV